MCSCGAASFAHMDRDDELVPSSPPASSSSSSKKKHNKNPYATRGLDKFSMVLAELESRREQIMARTGAQGVRFRSDSSRDWVPIIVRPKEAAKASEAVRKLPAGEKRREVEKREVGSKRQEEIKKRKGEVRLGCLRLGRWRESYYWPLVVVLILVCLVMFGRVFAICCTSIWWYMVPSMNERGANRKEIGRRLSDKRLGSPGAHGNGKKL